MPSSINQRIAARVRDHLPAEPRRAVLSPNERSSWEENGFLVLHGFFAEDEIEPVNELIEHLWERRQQVDEPITVDYLLNSTRAGHGLLRETPEDAKDAPYKLNNLIQWSDEVRALSCNGRLADVLAELLDGQPMAFNSLNFERGSQQGAHFDTWFMPAPVQNKMVATWIALEDIEPATGPLKYFPGSHLVDPYRFSHGHVWSVDAEMAEAERHNEDQIVRRMRTESFFPRKGDVLIWHSQLLHGGEPIEDLSLTRRSLVTHYFRAKEFDPASRRRLAPDEIRHQYNSMRPNWRPYFVAPTMAMTGDGRPYLDTRMPPPSLDDATALANLMGNSSSRTLEQLARRASSVSARVAKRIVRSS